MMHLTLEHKQRLYASGAYSFPPERLTNPSPWSMADWIRFIDTYGRWHIQAPTK